MKLWHQDMPEYKAAGERIRSRYVRMTQSEIEVDCNCVDILNALEKQDFGDAHSMPSVQQLSGPELHFRETKLDLSAEQLRSDQSI